MRKTLYILLFFTATMGFAQNDLLAKNYFEQGQYAKALTIYEKLTAQFPHRLDFFLAKVETNQQLENFIEAEKLLIDKINSSRNYPQLYVELGHNFQLQNNQIQADENYQLAISAIDPNPNFAYTIGGAFEKYSLLDRAIVVYEKAMLLNDKLNFSMQLANIYGEQGNLEKMFDSYLALILKNQGYKGAIQRYFSLYITEDPLNEANVILRKALLQYSQESQDLLYNQLLSWLFVQQKDFKKAFTQEKAIFKRTDEGLSGITNLAYIAIAEEDYTNSRTIVDFIIENAYTQGARLQAYQLLMKIELKTASPKQYPEIEGQFQKLLTEYKNASQTYLLQIDYNHFLAFQYNKKEIAIANLKELSKESLNPYQEARVKMELADILVFNEKFNEALIYYSQIQKKVQSDILAQEARFKVARTSYFKGDFQWAQVQLDVLKKSTSQLIANDAMQLSLIIQDNSLEDSTQTALKKYARADLLEFQDKNQESIAVLDDILTNNKGEKIEDEALFKQGQLFEKIGQFEKAETNYLKIIEFYKEDILVDDAHYYLAKLYETKLNLPDKAKQEYEQIIFNHSDSIYFVESRKKFRSLRGDAIN